MKELFLQYRIGFYLPLMLFVMLLLQHILFCRPITLVDRVFRSYTKPLQSTTVYRVEESVTLVDTTVAAGIDTACSLGNSETWLKPVHDFLGVDTSKCNQSSFSNGEDHVF